MAKIEFLYKSANELIATVTDKDGNAVTGATVTVDVVEDWSGTEVITDGSMSDEGGGEYKLTVSAGTLDKKNADYTAKVTVTSSGNQRYAEVPIRNVVDED